MDGGAESEFAMVDVTDGDAASIGVSGTDVGSKVGHVVGVCVDGASVGNSVGIFVGAT